VLSHVPGMEPLRVGVVRCGHWGPNQIRNFAALPEAVVVGAAGLELVDARADGTSGDPRVRYIVRGPSAVTATAGMGA
jgi:hypothetical protein